MRDNIMRKGFTLIELVVAIAVFSIGFVAVAKMQSNAISGQSYSMQMTDAVDIFNGQAENLNAQPIYPSYTSTAQSPDLTAGNHGPSTVTRRGINYSVSWVVSDLVLTAPMDEIQKQVVITVSWVESGINHNLSRGILVSDKTYLQ